MSILTKELLDSFEASTDSYETSATLPPVIYRSEEILNFEKEALFGFGERLWRWKNGISDNAVG